MSDDQPTRAEMLAHYAQQAQQNGVVEATAAEPVQTVFDRGAHIRFTQGPLHAKRPDANGYESEVTVKRDDPGVYLGPGHDELGSGADEGWHRCTVEVESVTYIVPVNDGRNDLLLRQFEARE